MKDKILELLQDIEEKHKVRVLLAVNYGSRSFGYSSPESDWDVRFFYVHRPEWYFCIYKTDDTVKLILDEEKIDMEGYDLKKALALLSKTNPNESDWLHASEYLMVDEDFMQTMLLFESQCYNSHRAMFHFYSISVKHNQRYLEREVTLKRFVYYMRGLLCCRWVEQHGCHPPVLLDELIDATIMDNDPVRQKAHQLIEMKRKSKSHDMEIVDTELSDYMFDLQKYYESLLPHHIDTKPKTDISAMSNFLMEIVLQK